MSAIKGRAKRSTPELTVQVTARVIPEARDVLAHAAEQSGISIALYLQTLLLEMDRTSGLPVFDHLRRPQWEELPIPAA